MIDKYEQAIKETFKYLDECLAKQPKKGTIKSLRSLGVDKRYVIESQMKKRGFEVHCTCNHNQGVICIYPMEHNLPIHIWREQ